MTGHDIERQGTGRRDEDQHPLCEPIQTIAPTVLVLKTQMNIGIALLTALVALVGTQTLSQIPRQQKYMDDKFSLQESFNAKQTEINIKHDKADAEMRENFQDVYDSEERVQSMLRQMDSKISKNTKKLNKPIRDVSFMDWMNGRKIN